MVCSLHRKWKREYDTQLRDSKQAKKEKLRNDAFSTPIGSKARRAYHLVHKNVCMSLPAVMKDPTNPKKMVTGHRVNEIWGSSATATRPNTMPKTSTEPTQIPPWLNPELWSELKSKINPLQNDLMAPLTHEDLCNFLKPSDDQLLEATTYNTMSFASSA
jgi:hypothetical protein